MQTVIHRIKKKTIIHRINNKVFLCSTGNYNHYPVINQNGKEYEKVYIYD